MRCIAQPVKKRQAAPSSQPAAVAYRTGQRGSALRAKANNSAATARLSALQRRADAGAGTTPVLQAYAMTSEDDVSAWRVSDSRKSGIPQDKSGGGGSLYAAPDIIKNGDDKLLAATSAIGLRQTETSLEYGAHTIYKVAPFLRDQAIADTDGDRTKRLKRINAGEEADDAAATDDEILALYTDCGKAARTIMGIEETGKAPKAETAIGDSKAGMNPEAYSKEMYPKAIKAFFGSAASTGFLKRGIHYRKVGRLTWFIQPWSAKSARKMYWALGEEGRAAFDKHVGINRFANPDIGDAYTMRTEDDMPGFASSGKTWNFHWAGVIGKDGPDNLTLEGYAVSVGELIEKAKTEKSGSELKAEIARLRAWAANYVDRDWVFQMYGTEEEGKTFHDDHLKSGTHGNRATTFHAKS